jgi:hypothetical protein
VTFAPEHFTSYWQNEFFPSIAEVDLARHPSPEQLTEELQAAGFETPRFIRLLQASQLSRAVALERIRGRSISTFDLLDEDEVEAGTEKAERELPELVSFEVQYLLAFARR